MSFLSLRKRKSSKSIATTHKSIAESFATAPSSPEDECLSEIDLSAPSSPPGTLRRKLQGKKSSSPTRSSGESNRPKSFRWPTGDPLCPSGAINFELSPPPSPTLSPSRDRWSFLSSFKNEPESPPARSESPTKSSIADWFQGESAPINLGLVQSSERQGSPETMNTDLRPSFLKRNSTFTNGRPRSPTKSLTSTQSTSRLGFFASAAKALSSGVVATAPAPQENDENDEFLHMDIKAALKPHGAADPFSPSSFNNLLQDAEGLLSRLQSAYQQRVAAVSEAKAELSAQEDEKEEVITRAQHLKQQLNDLSSENAQKDEIINELLAELKTEKRLRQEETDAKVRTVRMVDLPPKKQRHSRQSTDSSVVSDSGFESNNDEDVGTPSLTSSTSFTSLTSAPHFGHARQTSVTRASPTVVHSGLTTGTKDQSLQPSRRMQRSAAPKSTLDATTSDLRDSRGCDTCQGVNANAAWGVVANMREENGALRERNKHLEVELEGVLEMVNGLLTS